MSEKYIVNAVLNILATFTATGIVWYKLDWVWAVVVICVFIRLTPLSQRLGN